MQVTSNDKTARSNTVQDLKEFNSQSFLTPTKKKRTICFYDACYIKKLLVYWTMTL